MSNTSLISYPSVDKVWLKYYAPDKRELIIPDCSVYDYMLNANEDNCSAVALNYFGNKTTYQALIDKIDQCANAFLSIGVKRGDVVSFLVPTLPEVFIAFYALNKIGAIANMIDPRNSIGKIEESIGDTRSRIVLYIDIAYQKMKDVLMLHSIEKAISISAADSLPFFLKILYPLKNPKTVTDRKHDPKHLQWRRFLALGKRATDHKTLVEEGTSHPIDLRAGIVYTSGTTGIPKGAILTNKNLIAMVLQNKCADMGWSKNDRFLGIMPPFIAYGLVCGLSLPLCLGMQITIIPKFELEQFDSYILKYKPHHIMGVPSYIESLMHSKKIEKADLSFLKTVIVGGDRMNPEMEVAVNAFLNAHNSSCQVIKGYGLTEMSSNAVFPRCKECNKIGSVGSPLVGNNLKIIDTESGQELGYNEVGEICLTGPTLIDGYWNNEEETNKVFKTENGVRWLHTGDRGYIDNDGVVFFGDRIKRMIVRFDGFKVFPSKIESVITKSDRVKDCYVVGVDDVFHSQGQQPYAFVISDSRDTSSLDDVKNKLIAACRKELPDYSQPIGFTFMDSFPLTIVGKVDYQALERKAQEELIKNEPI